MKMHMYPQLAWDGIRKNKRLYLPYILTCIGVVAMYYIINGLASCPAVLALRGGDEIASMLGFGTFVMVVFSVIFLFYTNSFLLRRRRKEFGLYNILGLSKRHIGLILLWETLIIAVISLAAGLLVGWLLSKYAELVLVSLSKGDVTYSLSVSLPTIGRALEIYGTIFLLICLNALRGVHTANPIALLHSENVGEKPPRANWLLGLSGAVLLIAAYWIAVRIKEPLSALLWFFVAVSMVIVATYMLFVAGSVLLCRVLQKNRNYYYKPNHFISVSSLVYRMKRNGAGLASICVLVTMVLVMMTGSAGLYFGSNDIINIRYARDMVTDVTLCDLTEMSDAASAERRAAVEQCCASCGGTADHVLEYRYATITGMLNDGVLEADVMSAGDTVLFYDRVTTLNFMPLSDYRRITGREVSLSPGEVLIQEVRCSFAGDTIRIEDLELTVIDRVKDIPMSGTVAYSALPTLLVILPDAVDTLRPLEKLADYTGERMLNMNWYYGFDTDLSAEAQGALADRIDAAFRASALAKRVTECSVESREIERSGFFGTVGGILFLGIMLSVVFILATVLMIYYRQITEGYEDQARFGIMQKVGMTVEDIRCSINSQMLTVFALPLAFAVLHVSFAFPMIRQLLMLFNFTNLRLLLLTAGGTVLVFALFYVLVYRITSRVYFSIVRGAGEE